MQLQQIKTIIAVVWVLAVVGIMFAAGHVTSLSDRFTLGLLAVVPPAAMWFWWNDPVRTMSQNIHEARDERRGE
jgi:ABC-type nickel/cobalt efflux system permease component RcnA